MSRWERSTISKITGAPLKEGIVRLKVDKYIFNFFVDFNFNFDYFIFWHQRWRHFFHIKPCIEIKIHFCDLVFLFFIKPWLCLHFLLHGLLLYQSLYRPWNRLQTCLVYKKNQTFWSVLCELKKIENHCFDCCFCHKMYARLVNVLWLG